MNRDNKELIMAADKLIHDMDPFEWKEFRSWCIQNKFGDPISGEVVKI